MPIEFSINHDDGYFISKYIGKISNAELLDAYKNFYQEVMWSPALNELCDLSEITDMTELTSEGLENLCRFNGSVCKKHNIAPTVAFLAPKDHLYGMSRICLVHAEKFATVQIFRSMPEAEELLKKVRKDCRELAIHN